MQRASVMVVLLALVISFVPVDCLLCNALPGTSTEHKCCAPAQAEKQAACCFPGTIAATVLVHEQLGMRMSPPADGHILFPMHVLANRSYRSPAFGLSAPHRPQPPAVMRT